jgi:hypothetical protein
VSEPEPDEILPATLDAEGEEIVIGEVRALEPARPAVRPAVQAAAVAATGFVAGAATYALMRRGSQRRPAARVARPRAVAGEPRIVATRRYLVDVHLLARD